MVTPKRIAKARAVGPEKYLFGFTSERRGNGKSSKSIATVENEEPVGVKLTALAKSKGRKRPKKDIRLSAETTTALP